MRRASAGFTLLEIMLTLMILTIICTVLYGVVVSTVQAQQRIEEVTYIAEVGPDLLQVIRDDFTAAMQVEGTEEFFEGVDNGGQDRVDFVASIMSYGSDNDYDEPVFHSVNEIGYQTRPSIKDPGAYVLYRRLDYFLDERPLKGGRLTELYHRVVSFDVKYFDGKKWVGAWSTKERKGNMPRAIRVELTLQVPYRGEMEERTYWTTITRE